MRGRRCTGRGRGGVNTIVNCTFTAANGTALTAYSWADPADVRPGANQWLDPSDGAFGLVPTIGTNRAVGAVENRASIIQTSVADCTVSGVYRFGALSGADNKICQLAVRYADGNNYIICNAGYLVGTGIYQRVTKRVASVNTIVETKTPSLSINTDYAVTVVLSGNSLVFTIAGSTISATISDLATNTKHGVRLVVGADISIDTFKVTVP